VLFRRGLGGLASRRASRTTGTNSGEYQEDWGWELPANIDGQSYYLCVSGNAEETNAKPDEGEWGIIVEKKRSIFQRITGKGKITRDDGMLGRVSKILEGEPTIRGVHLEELR